MTDDYQDYLGKYFWLGKTRTGSFAQRKLRCTWLEGEC